MFYKVIMGLKDILESLGGSDQYFTVEGLGNSDARSCDKGGHLERSIANQPNHLQSRHVRNIIYGPQPGQPDAGTVGKINKAWFRSHAPITKARDNKRGN